MDVTSVRSLLGSSGRSTDKDNVKHETTLWASESTEYTGTVGVDGVRELLYSAMCQYQYQPVRSSAGAASKQTAKLGGLANQDKTDPPLSFDLDSVSVFFFSVLLVCPRSVAVGVC